MADQAIKVMQIAYATRDIEATARSLALLEGVGPFFAGEFPLHDLLYRGKPVSYAPLRVAFGYKGDLQYELIQPPDGEASCYTELLGDRRERLHHTFQTSDDDYDALVNRYETAGEPLAYHGTASDDRIRFGYVDSTRRLGHFVEVLETGRMVGAAAGVTALYDRMRRAAAGWNMQRPVRPISEA